jgi:hypothetical protein
MQYDADDISTSCFNTTHYLDCNAWGGEIQASCWKLMTYPNEHPLCWKGLVYIQGRFATRGKGRELVPYERDETNCTIVTLGRFGDPWL